MRRLLVETVWHYQHRPGVGIALARRRKGQPGRVIAIADKAQQLAVHLIIDNYGTHKTPSNPQLVREAALPPPLHTHVRAIATPVAF